MLHDDKEIEIQGYGKVTLIRPNWFNFLHDKVKKKMGGDLEYIASMSAKGWPYAVYRANNPNRSKGHKDWVGVCVERYYGSPKVVVTGWEKKDFEKYRYQSGVLCVKCREVIYSVERHDYRHCSCKTCMIDGGRDYIRRSQEGVAVRIDFFNMEIITS